MSAGGCLYVDADIPQWRVRGEIWRDRPANDVLDLNSF